MVILCKSQTICEHTQIILDEFLNERGLKVNKSKTKITHLKEPKTYINFLGYRVQKEHYKPNKYRKGEKWFIETPPKSFQNRKLKLMDARNKCNHIKEMFLKFDPILRGWLNYYSATNARKVYKRVNQWFLKFMLNCIGRIVTKWKFLRKKRRVSKTKMYTLIYRRYLVKLDPNKQSRWFRYIDRKAPDRRSNIILARPNGFPIVKPKPNFIPKASYYEPFDRTKLTQLALEYKSNKFKKEIYSKSDYKCQRCQNTLLDSNLVPEIHHKFPIYLGGSNKKSNLVLVCQPCHKFIHRVLVQKNNDEIQTLVASGLLILK
jgi:5-methylcytosine-specific restriction endonuclease McrA